MEWIDLRKQIYKRDEYKCQTCKVHCHKKGQIQCHHIIPYRIMPIDKEWNLMTLCIKDHTRLESFTNKILALNLFSIEKLNLGLKRSMRV